MRTKSYSSQEGSSLSAVRTQEWFFTYLVQFLFKIYFYTLRVTRSTSVSRFSLKVFLRVSLSLLLLLFIIYSSVFHVNWKILI